MSTPRHIEYPETDGLPMAENTLQFQWMVTIKGGLEVVFRDAPDVFIAGDLFWYPLEGNNQRRVAPDVLAVVGRPKGHRRSYLQWKEDNIAPQVVWEILSPSILAGELMRKFAFYEEFGVEEYYIYDPDSQELFGWRRQAGRLREIPRMDGWVSPRLQVRFDMSQGELRLFGPDGRQFATYEELAEQRDAATVERDQLAVRAEKLAAQLKALGVEPQS
jgi:Uma2 family endonuclease